jgi:hypothetical protein
MGLVNSVPPVGEEQSVVHGDVVFLTSAGMLLAVNVEVSLRSLVILVATNAVKSEDRLTTLVGYQYLPGQIDDNFFSSKSLNCHFLSPKKSFHGAVAHAAAQLQP